MPSYFETLIAIRDAAETNQLAYGRVRDQIAAQISSVSSLGSSHSKLGIIDRLYRQAAELKRSQGHTILLRDAAAREAAAINASLPPLPVPPSSGGIVWSTDEW